MGSMIKCYRCGKQYDLGYKNIKEIISCDHCHQQMKISDKSLKKVRLIRYVLVLILCLIIAYFMSDFSNNSKLLLLLITLSFAMLLAQFIDRICLYLADTIFHLQYEEYHPVKKSKKEIRKEKNNSKRKGLFKR